MLPFFMCASERAHILFFNKFRKLSPKVKYVQHSLYIFLKNTVYIGWALKQTNECFLNDTVCFPSELEKVDIMVLHYWCRHGVPCGDASSNWFTRPAYVCSGNLSYRLWTTSSQNSPMRGLGEQLIILWNTYICFLSESELKL